MRPSTLGKKIGQRLVLPNKARMIERAKYAAMLIPDEAYLRMYYRLRFGRRLDLRNPQTFTEKLQWLKLYDHNPLYTRLVDKHEVKSWVSDRIGPEHVIETFGVWDSFDQIEFDSLPSQFVLKCTHDSGGLSICRDKDSFDFEAARRKIESSLRRNYFHVSREWPYKDVPPRVLAERYLDDRGDDADVPTGMTDYKFYCFHGEPKFLYISKGLEDHATARRNFLNVDWSDVGFRSPDYEQFEVVPKQPSTYGQMLDMAKHLSEGMPFVRVDLYEHAGSTLFSEMTFHPTGGFMSIEPAEWDLEIGSWIDLSCVDGGRLA